MRMEQETLREASSERRPYELCLKYGPSALRDAELLAVILRCGTRGRTAVALAEDVLALCRHKEGLLGLLHLTLDELKELQGVGDVKAIQMQCIGELSKRIARQSAGKGVRLSNPEAIAAYYMEDLRHKEQEEVLLVMLDSKNRLLGETKLFRGTVNSSLISPREIFLAALSYHAVNLVLVHNHPSGDPTPSEEDLLITERILEAGALVGISLIDHIVIGDRCFFSIRAQGILSFEPACARND